MSLILTLIANPQAPALDTALVSEVAKAIASTDAPRWLAPEIACEIPVTATRQNTSKTIARNVRQILGANPIDVAIQPLAHRRKRLLVADMDSTIIGQECIDELGHFMDIKTQIAHITEQAMQGELPFDEALLARVQLLKGLPKGALQEVFNNRISLNPGARELIATMRANGAYCALVSGGFTFFTQRIAELTGFDFHDANRFIFDNGILTGDVMRPILGREAKLKTLKKIRTERHIPARDVMAVGDGANDLDMIAEAGLGVAYHAKAPVAKAADVAINHGDLKALLYLQGYSEAGIISDFTP